MNLFAHALPFLEDAWFAAGTCLPDWMSAVNRKIRLRSRKMALRTDDRDPVVAKVARGIVQHHQDDHWFHDTAAFVGLNLDFSLELRQQLPDADSLRSHFVGHILIEILLDDYLAAEFPGQLECFYERLGEIPGSRLQTVVENLAGECPIPLAEFFPRFLKSRFLFDYRDDLNLLRRLNQVMHRVGLAALPPALSDWLPGARQRVRILAPELLASYPLTFQKAA